jgi:ADP-ribosylglycohydrolase
MAMSMLHGLADMKPGQFDPLLIGDRYHSWFKSNPFDIGITTKNGLLALGCAVPRERLLSLVHNNVKNRNEGSLSNGALMRATPMAVYGHQLDNN